MEPNVSFRFIFYIAEKRILLPPNCENGIPLPFLMSLDPETFIIVVLSFRHISTDYPSLGAAAGLEAPPSSKVKTNVASSSRGEHFQTQS